MDDKVGAQEPLARFIFSKSHFNLRSRRVRHHAFMPTGGGETSVFRIEGLDEDAVWTIGNAVGSQRNQTLYARGDIKAEAVRSAKLDVLPSEPQRHANIVGWSSEKSQQKLRAMELAGAAKLETKP